MALEPTSGRSLVLLGASATGINTANQIVGTAVFPIKSYHLFRPGKHVAFIYRNGVLFDLNALNQGLRSGLVVLAHARANTQIALRLLCSASR